MEGLDEGRLRVGEVVDTGTEAADVPMPMKTRSRRSKVETPIAKRRAR